MTSDCDLSISVVDAKGKDRVLYIWLVEGEDNAINMRYLFDYKIEENFKSFMMIKDNKVFYRHNPSGQWKQLYTEYVSHIINEVNTYISKKIEESFSE